MINLNRNLFSFVVIFSILTQSYANDIEDNFSPKPYIQNLLLEPIPNNPSPHVVPIQVTMDTTTSVTENGNLPIVYKLHQIFPNPFNPITEIRFDLKNPGLTKLTVFDVLGRQVATLINDDLPAGYHSVRFEGTRFAAGVYFYRIESGKFHDIKKMVLIR